MNLEPLNNDDLAWSDVGLSDVYEKISTQNELLIENNKELLSLLKYQQKENIKLGRRNTILTYISLGISLFFVASTIYNTINKVDYDYYILSELKKSNKVNEEFQNKLLKLVSQKHKKSELTNSTNNNLKLTL
ncbi:hypothetical protein KLA_04372 [Cellulophaga geojensis KL-A]|uniref:Uncharacterized protein n=1 Tax=Cellulophaga geojensis KL-A TaxID=1328323 RepID=A0ABP3BCT2_9FLAO|nr:MULTISPECIES: hypothetical protein [Cellulophaga]EWH14572.1 hypothetical protein KLA_04372 [Cellulophaga geojensis KL-A]MDO6851955.1 hypothetical protein [Cellulophaga lytica]